MKYNAGFPNQRGSVDLRFSIGICACEPTSDFPTAKDQCHTESSRMLMSN
jgi:hypothetical protein